MMSMTNENLEIHKLSELMSENDEITSDVNKLIKELKNYKKIDKDTYDVNRKKYEDLLNDIEEVLNDIEACQRENDPQLISFDSDKKSTRQKALKNKKLLEENFSKFEKSFKKNVDNSTSKQLKDPQLNSTKNNDIISSKNFEKEKSKSQNVIDNENEKIKTIKKESKGKNKKLKSKGIDENVEKVNEIIENGIDEKIEEKEITAKRNLEKPKRKGILKSSFQTKQLVLIDSNGKIIDEKVMQDESSKDPHEKKGTLSNDDKNPDNISIVSELDLNTQIMGNDEIKNKDSILNKNENLIENTKKTENIQKLKENNSKNKTKLKQFSSKKENSDQLKISELEKQSFDENHIEKAIKIIESYDDPDSDFENENEIHEKNNMPDSNPRKNSTVTSAPNNNLSKTEILNSKNLLSDNFEKNENSFFEKGKSYVSNGTYSANEKDDLSLASGEEVLLLDIMEDDWFYVKNGSGLAGYVPKSYLKEIEIIKCQDKNEILDENVNSVTTVSNFHSSSLLNEETESWVKIKLSMQKRDINELLKACGNLPSGFRFSTICNLSQENSINSSLFAYCYPKLSDSTLSFCDLQDAKIRPQPVKIQRQIQIVKVFQLPLINSNFIVKSRHVRLCLFNGNKIVSNIHLIRASANERDMRIWNFVSKINDSSKSLECGEIFLRFNQSTTEVSLLMEFCILGFKMKLDNTSEKKIYEKFSDDELIEFSIGWTSVPLYENNGQLINAKKSDFLINGGTPFEKGVEVDPTGYTSDKGKSKTALNQNKQPHVTLRIYLPNKENKELLETLPTMIVGCTLDLVALSFYRRILAETILDSRRDLTSSKSLYSPFLISFTQIVESSDILDITRMIWNEKLRNIKDFNRKDNVKMNELFQKVFMDYIYPVTKIEILSVNNLARPDLEQIRVNKILEIIQKIKLDSASILLNEEYSYNPLTFSELNFNIMFKYEKRK